jgi:hypothetical protein
MASSRGVCAQAAATNKTEIAPIIAARVFKAAPFLAFYMIGHLYAQPEV